MKGIFRYLILFCVVFLITAGLGYYSVYLFTHSQKSVVVPDFTGKNIIYVLETTTRMGLNARLMGTQHHDTIEEYSITSQNPEPGAMIKTGRDVSIYISKGKQQRTIPALMGMSLTEAELILERQEISPGVISTTFSSEISRDHVIAQSPRALTQVSEKRICHLLVSKGPGPISMPDLIGLSVDKALEELSRNGLQEPDMQTRLSGKAMQSKIMGQQPSPGSRVFSHTKVTIITGISQSSGRKNVSPNGLVLSHTLTRGFLKKQVRVEMDLGGLCLILMDEYLPPGKTIDLLLPSGVHTSIRIFVDNKLVREKQISHDSLKLQNTPSWQFLEETPQGVWITGDNLCN